MKKLLNQVLGKIIFFFSLVSYMLNKTFRDKIFVLQNSIQQVQSKDVHFQLVDCIVKIEDVRFFEHTGVDFFSIGRAINNYFFKGRKEGASTITQQFVRIIIGNYELKYSRKIAEILLASFIDKRYSKQEILNSYCHNYTFENCKGIAELCVAEKVDINAPLFVESCQIAARFKYPILRKNNYTRYLKRVRIIEIKTTSKIFA